MNKKKIHININTRILLYFLFVTILPLAILALSSTILIHFSLSEKSEEELANRIESLQSLYNSVFTGYKNIVNSDSYLYLVGYKKELSKKKIEKALIKIKDYYQLSFITLFDNEFKVIDSISGTNTLILYPLGDYKCEYDQIFEAARQGNIVVSNEILNQKQLKYLALKNKVVLKKEIDKPEQNNYGLLTQIGLIPIFEKNNEMIITPKNIEEINETGKEIDNKEKEDNINQDIESNQPDEVNIQIQQEPIGYLFVGNFLNSNEDLSKIIKDRPNLPVNITQLNYFISSNSKIPFDVSSIEENQNQNKILNTKMFKGEHFLNNQWYRLGARSINNFKNDSIALMIVGIEEDLYRSLKSKNSLLMLQVSILVATGGLVLAFLFTKSITDPISKMREAVKNIESGNLSYELEIPVEDELGDLALSINQMAQVLESKKNEILRYNQILLDQKSKLETIFNYSADGIMTLSEDKKIYSINPVVSKWLNKNLDEIVGKYFYDIIIFESDPARYSEPPEKIEDIKDLNEIYKYYPGAKINNVELEISYSSMKPEGDSITGYVLILRDITKRKETEELRENFIATLTHDLRTPLLASVQTLKYLLKGSYGSLSEDQNYITNQLINSNEGLLRMVNTLLDTFSYESGKQSLVKREINLYKLINECINEMKPLADGKNHNIKFDRSDSSCFVTADKQEIKRVIINILSNAIMHTTENGIIEFDLKTDDSFATLSIMDNGIGLSEKDKERIFNRYSRGGRTLRKIGTGLGLYLSKHIVEAHGGRIWVESKLKEGSVFSFTIPLSITKLDTENNG
ncbi:MAG: ATP-binding protein [Cyanobacteriota bacterium]